MKRTPTDFRCSACGTTVSPNARSCTCGARLEGRHWVAAETDEGLDLEDDFDYEAFLEREFGESAGRGSWWRQRTAKERFWWVVAILLLIAFTALALGAV